jgi:hypothetical protein
MYQASVSRVNKIVSSVPNRLSSFCRDRRLSDFPKSAGLRLTKRWEPLEELGAIRGVEVEQNAKLLAGRALIAGVE